MTLHTVWMHSNHLIWGSNQTKKPTYLKSWLFVVIIASTDQDTIEKWSWSRSRIPSVSLIRWSSDHTIVQLNHKIITHQVIQDPLTVRHQQSEKRMFDGRFNTQRVNSIFLTLYHFLLGSNIVFTSTIGCRSFQTCVTALHLHLFTCVLQHMSQGFLIVRSHRGISRSHDCEKMFQVLQTLAFAWNNSLYQQRQWRNHQIFWKWHSRNRTRRIQSTPDVGVWKFHSTSRRFHNGCHTRRDRQTRVEVSLLLCTEVWLQKWTGDQYAVHAIHSWETGPRASWGKMWWRWYRNWKSRLPQRWSSMQPPPHRLSRPHLDAVTSIHQLRRRTQRPGISSCHQSCQLHHLIIAPSTHHKTAMSFVTSRTTQSNLNSFQHWLTQTFCQRHHVFLETNVHDHIQQVTRFVRGEIGVVPKRQSVQREPTRVEFLSPPHFQRVPPQQPKHLRLHQKTTHMTQMTTLAILVSTRTIRPLMTDLSTSIAIVCASTARTAFARTLATAARETWLASRFLTLSGHRSEMSGLATIAALRIAESTPRFVLISIHRRSQVLIHICTQHCPGLWSTKTQMLFQRSFLDLFQTSNRERLTSIVSQRGHHLSHQSLSSQSLILKAVRGCPVELKHVWDLCHSRQSCRIARVFFQARSCRSRLVSRAPLLGQKE